ncbi:hypothetical protein T01_15397, partial [Trichinella spiralis]
LKNKDNKHVNGKIDIKMSYNDTKSGSSEWTCNVSQKCQRQIFFRPTRSSRSRLITRVLFENNGRRELKETPSSNWKIPCQAIIDHRAIENSVSTNHIWRERKETTTANFGRNVKSRNLKQQILRKHGLLKNKDGKHVNGKKMKKMSCNNTKSGSSECTVILSVMYHSNVSGRSDIRAVLIARAFPLVSVQLENSVPSNHVLRERKETIELLKILYLPITFGVSEKRLRGQILDEMRSVTPPP